MSVSFVGTSKSTAFKTFDILDENVQHQIVMQAFVAAAPATPLNPSSGIVALKYRPVGSTAYLALSTTIDLSSGPVIYTWSSVMSDSINLTHTHGTSTLMKTDYRGWRR